MITFLVPKGYKVIVKLTSNGDLTITLEPI